MLLLGLLAGCAGTFLTQVETGYEMAPRAGEVAQGGALAGHMGGSSTPGLGLGATLRARVWGGGWAFPEFGPHVFYLFEDDGPYAIYTRLALTGGLGGVRGELGPMFTAELSPGVIVYPGEDVFGITFGLIAAGSTAPVSRESWVWLGLRVGVAIGGVKED